MRNGKLHVLIVTCNRIDHAIISLIIEKAGYETSQALSGIQALEMLKSSQQFDAILLSWGLTGMMSSIDFMRKIHALSSSIRNIPILMLAEHEEKGYLKYSMLFGISEIIYKPVDEVLLHKTLEKIKLEFYTQSMNELSVG